MISRISRYLIIAIAILIAAIFLPDLYWLSFGDRIRQPFVSYSPITEDFIVGKFKDKKFKWMDLSHREYSLQEVDSLLPLSNYRQLASKGRLPDSVQGVAVSLDEIRLNNFRQRIKPVSIGSPPIGLYPLFESNPSRLELEMPRSFFRINDRMEFIISETNETDENQTKKFTKALVDKGFNFPATLISGNPTTRKPFDEGYFILDSRGQLFHVKMIDNLPAIKNTNKPEDIRVKDVFISERNLREFYGILISEDDHIYLMLYDNYRLQRLPVDDYDASHEHLMLQGNLLYRIINRTSSNSLKSTVTNRDYTLIATHQESWKNKYEQRSGEILAYIFPFTLSLQNPNSIFVGFYFQSYLFTALLLNFVFVIVFLFLSWKKRKNSATTWIDAGIIALTGVYGFLAIALIPGQDNE